MFRAEKKFIILANEVIWDVTGELWDELWVHELLGA
jgi:hypothetical protein